MPSCIYNAKCHCILSHVTCIIHYMEQFISRTLCQVPWIIISKAYNLHSFMLIYVTPIYQHIYNTFNMLLYFEQKHTKNSPYQLAILGLRNNLDSVKKCHLLFFFLTTFKIVINGYKFIHEAILKLGQKTVLENSSQQNPACIFQPS